MVTKTYNKKDNQRATIDLWPDAGRVLGLSRGSTYAAAKRGQIFTVRIGRRLLVPKTAIQRLLQEGDVRG